MDTYFTSHLWQLCKTDFSPLTKQNVAKKVYYYI